MNLLKNKLFLLGVEYTMSIEIFALLEKKNISTDVLLLAASNARVEKFKNKFTVG